jgi:hypothetical protein
VTPRSPGGSRDQRTVTNAARQRRLLARARLPDPICLKRKATGWSEHGDYRTRVLPELARARWRCKPRAGQRSLSLKTGRVRSFRSAGGPRVRILLAPPARRAHRSPSVHSSTSSRSSA